MFAYGNLTGVVSWRNIGLAEKSAVWKMQAAHRIHAGQPPVETWLQRRITSGLSHMT